MTIRSFYIDPKKAKGINFSFYRFFGKFFSKFWFSHLISNEEEMPTFEGHELLLKPIYCGVCGTDVDKVMNINKPYARKVRILTVLEQRAKVMGKMEQARLAKAAKATLKRQRK